MKNKISESLSEDLLNDFDMITHWLIQLSESIGNTSDPQLQEVLRFNRWYLERELHDITGMLESEDIEYSYCLYLTALYASNESEIQEFQLALDGKGEVWNASGEIQSTEEIIERLGELKSYREDLVSPLCPECRKEAGKIL